MRTATFQRRWFVLKANLLFYQERPADRHLLGVIVLEGCAVRCLAAEEQFAFSLVFGPGLKTYTFAAENRQAQESWVEALMSASHCYLSLLVKNLEREYEGRNFFKLFDFYMLIFHIIVCNDVISNEISSKSPISCHALRCMKFVLRI